MEFIFSLTHFCDLHGPKSVLCTQVQPSTCSYCLPESPELKSRGSEVSFDTAARTLRSDVTRQATSTSLSPQFSRSSTVVESVPPTPSVEHNPYFVRHSADELRPSHYATGQSDTCASCTFTVPEEFAKKIPAGAPGSPQSSSPGSNGSPVLRTRQMIPICPFDQSYSATFEGPEDRHCDHSNQSGSSGTASSSLQSSTTSTSSDPQCHQHELEFLTLRAPRDPTEFALLRAAVIRTLSSEMLPRGLSSGPIVVGDSTNGYTIAHVFRLPDPKARGRRRSYAFVALAGEDGVRALRAFPVISAAFNELAEKLVSSAERHQEEQKRQEEKSEVGESQNRRYTPVSSFLTQRVDPDGQPRRIGQTIPRSLAEITGNPKIFAEIHLAFCMTLFALGKRLELMPMGSSFICESLVKNDRGTDRAYRPQVNQQGAKGLGLSTIQATTNGDLDKIRDLDTTPTPSNPVPNVQTALARMSMQSQSTQHSAPHTHTTSPNSTCTPLQLDTQRKQVMV